MSTTCTGKYQHESNENLDAYFTAVGVPYIPRKLILTSHPDMTIEYNKDTEEWTITNISFFKTTVLKFKLGEEYEEYMPGIVLKVISSTPKFLISLIITEYNYRREWKFNYKYK